MQEWKAKKKVFEMVPCRTRQSSSRNAMNVGTCNSHKSRVDKLTPVFARHSARLGRALHIGSQLGKRPERASGSSGRINRPRNNSQRLAYISATQVVASIALQRALIDDSGRGIGC